MPIIHNKARDNFSIVSNVVLRHNGLSWKAKGIYAYLCGCESGFNITQASLAAFGDCGVAQVKSGLDELIKFGLLEIEQENEGSFGGNRWTINAQIAVMQFSDNGKPDNGKPDNGFSQTNKSNDNNINLNNVQAFANAPAAPKKKEPRPRTEQPVDVPAELQELIAAWPHPIVAESSIVNAWNKAIVAGASPSTILDVGRKWARHDWCYGLKKWIDLKCWEKPPQQPTQNANSYKSAGAFGRPQTISTPSQIDKRILMLTNRYAKIPPRLWPELQNESEEVLDYINRNAQLTNGASGAEVKAIAKEYLRKQAPSEDIFSQILNKSIDSGSNS